jgi:hypothetical protein
MHCISGNRRVPQVSVLTMERDKSTVAGRYCVSVDYIIFKTVDQ